MTPEEAARFQQTAEGQTEAVEQQKADARERRYQRAKKNVAAENTARPTPQLIFDGEEDLSPTTYLIGGTIPEEGAGELFGETDVGKTFVALSMGIAVAAGVPWQGRDTIQGTVLFIETEGGKNFALRKHAAKLEVGEHQRLPFITDHEALNFGPDVDVVMARARAHAIRAEVAERGLPPIRFVVADTLAQNIHGDADANHDMTEFLKLFRAFLKALSDEPVFGLLIHHPGHENKDRGRGAYSLPADLDLVMHLDGTQDALVLTCKRLRVDPKFLPIPLALESRIVRLDDGSKTSTLVVVERAGAGATRPESKEQRAESQIVAYLILHPMLTTKDLSKDLHIHKTIVVKIVDVLVKNKVLARHDRKTPSGQVAQRYEVVVADTTPNTEAEVPSADAENDGHAGVKVHDI